MRALGASRTSLVPGGVLAGPWVRNDLWRRARAVPSLDLRFADNKSLVDATTGANLVDFTRASSGTYVDSEGVIRTATTNLALRSEKIDEAVWSLGNGATITSTTDIAAPNGTMTAWTLTSSGAVGQVQQVYTGISGATYTGSFWVRRRSGTGTVNIRVAENANTALTGVTSDWQRFSFTATSTSTTIRIGINLSGTADAVDLWGAQLEQSSTVGEYIPTTSTINSAPRFDHDPTTGESLGLLVEEQRTNVLLRSEEFETTWTRTNVAGFGSGSEVNVETAPNGTLTADLVALTGSINSGTGFIYQDITKAATATTYTATVFAKAQDWDALTLQVNDASTNNNRANVTFSLTTGQITTEATAVGTFSSASAAATSFGNGWFRASLTFTSSTETGLRIRIYPNNSTTVTSNGSNGIYIWGAQLEAGSFPTSYIPTTNAAATRAADVASIDSGNFSSWYRQDEGTVFAEFQPRANATAGVVYLNAGSVNEATRIFYDSTISNYTFSVRADSVEQSSINNLGAYVLQPERISAAYKVNDLAASRNGGASVSDVSATLPTGIDRLNLGTTQGPNYLNGTIRRLTYWPARLPDSTLQTITQ
jgi:hypothetical protein